MTRSILVVTLAIGALAMVAGQGCGSSGIGDPCTPDAEYDPTFSGFSLKEVNVESKSFQCQTRLCLVNHFRGRVSCPQGQNFAGEAPSGKETDKCKVPGTETLVTGALVNPKDPNSGAADPKKQKCVQGQCSKRTPDRAVYCSCRCANVNGRTDDGGNYCACPDGYACEQLVSSTGLGNEGLTGGYCIKNGTKYDANDDPCGDPVQGGITTCPD
jgi:hypothetical protein